MTWQPDDVVGSKQTGEVRGYEGWKTPVYEALYFKDLDEQVQAALLAADELAEAMEDAVEEIDDLDRHYESNAAWVRGNSALKAYREARE